MDARFVQINAGIFLFAEFLIYQIFLRPRVKFLSAVSMRRLSSSALSRINRILGWHGHLYEVRLVLNE